MAYGDTGHEKALLDVSDLHLADKAAGVLRSEDARRTGRSGDFTTGDLALALVSGPLEDIDPERKAAVTVLLSRAVVRWGLEPASGDVS